MYRVELSFLIGACDERLKAALAHRQSAFYDGVDQAYIALLEAYRLQIRAPFTLRDLSRAVAAQIAGSVVIWNGDPELLNDPMGEPGHSLMSRSILAVFHWLTEPIPEDSPTS